MFDDIKLTNWENSSIYSEGSSEGIMKIIPMLMQNCECICYLKNNQYNSC